LEREISRDWRFEKEADEQKLLDAANPHLRAVLIALLDTAARLGEVLSLQWKDVNLDRRELVISCREIENANRANRADFRSPLGDARDEEVGTQRASRYLPTHTSLVDAIGRRVKSVRTAWEYTCDKAGPGDQPASKPQTIQ